MKTRPLPKKIYRLCETVADIAFIAGGERYYGGDSREDVSNFIKWALEFEELHKGEAWDGGDYIQSIENFAEEKLNPPEVSLPTLEFVS